MAGSSSTWLDMGRQLLIGRNAAWMVSVATALGASLYGYYAYFGRMTRQLKAVGKLSTLYIYPIKSCRGIAVQSAQCTKLGLKIGSIRDRNFLLVTSEGMFVTGRQEHRLLLAVPSFDGDDILVDGPDMETLRLSPSRLKAEQLGEPVKTKIWGNEIRGYDCGDQIAGWFQRLLGKPGYRLLYYKEDLEPKLGQKTVYRQFFKKGDASVYSDLTAYLMLSEESIEDLNTRLENPVSVVHFRPNLVVRGCEPYAEDKWRILKIGDTVSLRYIKPCPRCMMTTIDPDTAVRDKKEPLKTLKTYRKNEDPVLIKFDGETPCMGVGLSTDIDGQIRVGDIVYAAA